MKVEVAGRLAKLYLNGSDKPTLIVDGLKGEDLHGVVALWGFPGQETYFSNLRITPAEPKPLRNGTDPAGKWQVKATSDGGPFGGTLTLAREGNKLTGQWSGVFGNGVAVEGTWRDGYVELRFTGKVTKEMGFAPGDAAVTLAGWADGAAAKGRAKVDGRANGQWTATRVTE